MKMYHNLIIAVLMTMALPMDMMAAAKMRCQSCAEKVAIKQSIKEALAAAALAAKEQENKPAQEDLEKCGCSKPKPKPARDHDSNNSSDEFGDIKKCCKTINKIRKELKEQGQDAKKCCKKTERELSEIEDLILSQTDAAALCCSTEEALLSSIIDRQGLCCSTEEALLTSIIDTQAVCCALEIALLEGVLSTQDVCCSTTEALLSTVIDSQAACCSVTEGLIGACPTSLVDILGVLTLPAGDITTIDNVCLDVSTMLKSIYALLAQVFVCTCT